MAAPQTLTPFACLEQEVGKENLFTFGVDAKEVPRLREERKNFKDYDPRWKEAFKLIYNGEFGDKEYFKASSRSLRQIFNIKTGHSIDLSPVL